MAKPRRTQAKAVTIGNRLAPVRFLAFLVILPVAYLSYRALVGGGGEWRDGAAIAFDIAAFAFVASLIPLLRDCSTAQMRRHSEENDANRLLVLAVTTLLTFVAMAAITGEMDGAKHGDPSAIVKLIVTMLLIWLFANSVYALHYAHAFYGKSAEDGGDRGGIEFPGTKTPHYWDFAYFAFTLGMTFQTSDVQITAPGIRRIALLHSFAAFVFNIGAIAFTINVLGGS